MDVKEMAVGPRGWVRYLLAEDAGYLYVRFRPVEGGRWRISEVYLDLVEPVGPRQLRALPYAHCEEWANEGGTQLAAIWDEPDAVGDNMAILAAHLGVSFNALAHEDRSDWVALAYFASMPLSRRHDAGFADLRTAQPQGEAAQPEGRLSKDDQPDLAFRLTSGPSSRRLTDEFLELVARAYLAALARGEAPNVSMQRDLGDVDHRTVVRWVAEARRRGYLQQARKGVAG